VEGCKDAGEDVRVAVGRRSSFAVFWGVDLLEVSCDLGAVGRGSEVMVRVEGSSGSGKSEKGSTPDGDPIRKQKVVSFVKRVDSRFGDASEPQFCGEGVRWHLDDAFRSLLAWVPDVVRVWVSMKIEKAFRVFWEGDVWVVLGLLAVFIWALQGPEVMEIIAALSVTERLAAGQVKILAILKVFWIKWRTICLQLLLRYRGVPARGEPVEGASETI